ncbi:1491_t:CDS:1, partial [Racocetra persica]
RNCWSLRPLLGEGEYSENSYVIHAVSRVVDPIFNYYKWNLKRSWYNTLVSCADSHDNCSNLRIVDWILCNPYYRYTDLNTSLNVSFCGIA